MPAYSDNGKITRGSIKLAVGNWLRTDGDIRGTIELGWSISPSIGLVAKDLRRLGLELESFKEPITKSIKQVMMPSIRKNFQMGGRPDSWEPLAEYTIEVRGNSGPILVRTGALARGASSFGIWTVSDTSAAVKGLPNSIWYGAIHQAGAGGFGSYMDRAKSELGHRPRGSDILKLAFEMMAEKRGSARKERKTTIPQRQFIMYQEDDIDDIQQIFYEWLVAETIKVGKFSK
jgi:phage gpG-like protein